MWGYVYDNNGNITEIKRDGEVLIQYAYDGLNQLVREDNAILGTICSYTYDTAGNITEKKVHNRTALGVGVLEDTVEYGYATSDWKDRLVSYGNETISYDALGNPTSYRGHTLVWGKVKQLQAYDTNSFTYNAEGIRTSKNNITYELDGTQIIREVRGANVIEYFYGSNGVSGFTYNGTQYYYQKNIQGDITAIYSASGTKVAEYVYDAWGKCTVVLDTNGIGTINPFRYRGYYYDIETGLYYIQSRYYDPVTGRFINADDIIDQRVVLSYNLFAYCLNNPSNMADDSGHLPFFIITGAIGALFGGVIGYATTGTWQGALTGAAIGGVIGLTGGAAAAEILTGSAIAQTGAVLAAGQALLGITAAGILSKAEEIAQGIGKIYRNFTQGNFRHNLQQLTGFSGGDMQAHHIFPQKFLNFFSQVGINIHNPLFGAWVGSDHQSWSYAYNKAWETFFNTVQNPTAQQIFDKVAELAKQYGFNLNF